MISLYNKLFIKFITPLIWRFFPSLKWRALAQFSQIEKDSAIQLLDSLHYTESGKVKADLFQHVLEEFCHADLFAELSLEYSQKHINMQIESRSYLLKRNSNYQDFLKFYAYAHVGEAEVNSDFRQYSKANIDKKMQQLFYRIAQDEDNHKTTTEDILTDLCQSKSKAKELIRHSQTQRLIKIIIARTRSFGTFLLTILLTFVYFLCGPFFYKSAKKQLSWSRDKHLQFLKQQIKAGPK